VLAGGRGGRSGLCSRGRVRPAAAVGFEACQRRAEVWLAEVRRKRRDLEARLGEREAFRVHARQCG
jgi:hypothetical protein